MNNVNALKKKLTHKHMHRWNENSTRIKQNNVQQTLWLLSKYRKAVGEESYIENYTQEYDQCSPAFRLNLLILLEAKCTGTITSAVPNFMKCDLVLAFPNDNPSIAYIIVTFWITYMLKTIKWHQPKAYVGQFNDFL